MIRLTQLFTLSLVSLGLVTSAFASDTIQYARVNNPKPTVKKYRPYVTPANPLDTRWVEAHPSPWDFSGLLGLYNPGFGLGVRAAYRFSRGVLEDVDDSVSFETGLGYVGASNTYGGVSATYSLVEIPFLVRWDFRINDTKFILGPEAGLAYLFGSSVTVNGVTYSTPGGSIYVELGGFGMYQFNQKWAARVNLGVGGYTTITAGITYFP